MRLSAMQSASLHDNSFAMQMTQRRHNAQHIVEQDCGLPCYNVYCKTTHAYVICGVGQAHTSLKIGYD